MGQPKSETPVEEILDKILGYLNFSSGQHEPPRNLFAEFFNAEYLK